MRGLDDLFMELDVDKAEDFVQKKCEILKKYVTVSGATAAGS